MKINREKKWLDDRYVEGLVSVIIPTFNRKSALIKAIDSVRLQNYRPIEVIIVDDGSIDGTCDVVNVYTGQHKTDNGFLIKYIYKNNSGATASRNVGLVHSSGEYIQFLDSDDILLPKKISLGVNELANDKLVDFIYTQLITETNGNKIYRKVPCLEHSLTPSIVAIQNLNTPSALYRRNLLQKVGPWNEQLLCCQEWEYNVRVVSNAKKTKFINSPGAVIRIDGNDRIGKVRSNSVDHLLSRAYSIECVYDTLVDSQDLEGHVIHDLAFKIVSSARAALPLGRPEITRSILLSKYQIWKKGGFGIWLQVIIWFNISLLPIFLTQTFLLSLRNFKASKMAKKRNKING